MFNKKEYDKRYRESHKEELRIYLREYNQQYKLEKRKHHHNNVMKVKNEVLTYYGSGECRCVKCGFNDIRALTLDHINGDGGKERSTLQRRRSGYYFYLDLKKRGFPTGYQTLCSNCQRIKQVENNEWRGCVPVEGLEK